MVEKYVVTELQNVAILIRCGKCHIEVVRPLRLSERSIDLQTPEKCTTCGVPGENLRLMFRIRYSE